MITEEIIQIAHKLPNCYYIGIVSVDGLMMAYHAVDSESTIEEDLVASLNGAIISIGERASTEFGGGDFRYTVTGGTDGWQFTMALCDEAGFYEAVVAFGVREVISIDAILVFMRQWVQPIMKLI
jgi:predicted regulator of Ras-like GTPase activity (Roadblock/LC7/MglB family)